MSDLILYIGHSRGCVTIITERDRIETESALNEVRRSAGDVLFQDLETRDGQAGPHEAVNATVVGGARVLRRVAFDVHWHVLYANETYEGGYVPDYQIMQQMEVLNRDYKSTNISWNFVNITRIHNPDWFVNAWPGSPQEAEMKETYHKGNSSTLNIFTAGFNATDKSLGYASLPSAYFREPLKDGLIIRYTTLPGGSHKNYNLGRTTVHELGHWLGLYHTFEAYRSGKIQGGCTGVGDNVDDTPPESSGAEGCPIGRKSCPDSKEPDPIHNFMDYSFDSCMTHFTPGQAVRMHEAIWAFRTPRPPPPGTSGNYSTIASATSTTSSAAASNSSSATTTATSPAPTTRTSSGSSLSSSSSTSATPTTPTSAPTSSTTAAAEAGTTETDEHEQAVESDSTDDAESRLADFSSSDVHQREEDWDEEYERDYDDDDE
ncbi:hypothetical protein H1R20_g8051, partial [Candolleomyces eurysporus]